MPLKLVGALSAYEVWGLQYKYDMRADGDSFGGGTGLEQVGTFVEWMNIEDRLKRICGEGNVPAETAWLFEQKVIKLIV